MRTNTTTKSVALFATVVAALLVTTAGPASAKTNATGGGGQQVSYISPDPGLVNKLNAMLDELPNAGVARPSR